MISHIGLIKNTIFREKFQFSKIYHFQSMGGVFFNKGENCIAAGRIFVESSIHDEFVKRVVDETKKIVSIFIRY